MSSISLDVAGDPDGELQRLSALYRSGVLDDGSYAALDELVALAASLLACPVAMLNVIDHDVMRVCASVGTSTKAVPREVSLCGHAIRQAEVMVVPDLCADPRFADSPVINGGIRFYAGAPVTAPDPAGAPRAIGALCVTDATPRDLDERGRQVLRRLAGLAETLIAARADTRSAIDIAVEHQRVVAEVARQHRLLGQAERMTGIGSWRLTLADEHLEWSEGVKRIYGVPATMKPTLADALLPYPEEARGRVSALLATAMEHGFAFDFEEDFRRADGELRRVRSIGECEQIDGRNVAVVGVFQDITDRHRLETALRRDADTDRLTGLANRAAFDRGLDAAIDRARQGTPLLLVLVDLDGFKVVNDTLGHAAGDDVLRKVGTVLRALPFATTMVGRIGGDEFALLVEQDADDPAAIAATVERALLLSASGNGVTLACSGSVGTAMFDGERARDFFHRADVALYAAKRARIGERRTVERRAA